MLSTPLGGCHILLWHLLRVSCGDSTAGAGRLHGLRPQASGWGSWAGVLARSVMWELPNFPGLQFSHILGGNSETPKDWYSLRALCNCLVKIGTVYSSV